MDAPPAIRPSLGSKVWDFALGCLLIGASPLATAFGLAYLLNLASGLIFRHFGERTAFSYQMISGLIAFLLAFPAFGCAIWWRTRHRLLPGWAVVAEVLVAVVWAFFFFAFIGVLIGPNDDWNQ
ncbi:MAG: hypothetical protein NT154_00505 [Verrucomicrobia bacterium]|nr:hypothetical protein [Verrucomicrobiota bacterium]